MLVFVTLLLISVGGVLCEDAECRDTEVAECHALEKPSEFPKTIEQFDSDCRIILTFMNCVSDVMEKCGYDDEDAHRLRRLIFYVQMQVCNSESHIYEVLTSNIECIDTTLPKVLPMCNKKSNDKRMRQVEDALEDYLLEKLDTVKDISVEDKRDCMDTLFGLACSSVFFGQECGRPVGDTALDMLTNMYYHLEQQCPESLRNELPYVVNALYSIAEAGEEVENEIKKKK